jgi:hypothetical protein
LEDWQMHKHWMVVVVFAVVAVTASALWASCGDDSGADAGVPDTGATQCAGKATGDQCTGGFCIEVSGGANDCSPECSVAGDPCELAGSAGACYNIGIKDKNACMKAGTKGIGEGCGAFNECTAGMACLDMSGSMVCFAICGTVDTCSGDNPSCDPSGFGFGVCVEGEASTTCTDVDANDCPEGYTCTDVDGDLICV